MIQTLLLIFSAFKPVMAVKYNYCMPYKCPLIQKTHHHLNDCMFWYRQHTVFLPS